MIVIGAGLVGRSCAWLLQGRGHQVQLLDPCLNGAPDPTAGSWAALGVVMAHVFQRSSGRAWRLRQRSLHLWGRWRQELGEQGWPLAWQPGLLILASSPTDLERQQRLQFERQRQAIPLEIWSRQRLADLSPALPDGAIGGLYSPADGQLDPGPALEALLGDGRRLGIQTCGEAAARLERRSGQWTVHTQAGQALQAEAVVLSAGVASAGLLEPLDHFLPLEPVLGQALELELPPGNHWGPSPAWPGAVVWQGLNLVPRPPSQTQGERLWLGATLEPGCRADPDALAALRELGGAAPTWLRQAQLVRHWQGHRPHPIGRPAPLLEQLEPGLVLASGHYRNGLLLAPATAEWVAQQLEAPS